MPKYPITQRQQDMIRDLYLGLKDETLATEWLVTHSSAGITVVPINTATLSRWNNTNLRQSDLDKFTDVGFMRLNKYDKYGYPSQYTLDEYAIIQAVENDFDLPETFMPIAQNTFNFDNVSGIVNIQSNLQNAHQIINHAPQLDDNFKQEFMGLLEQLAGALKDVPQEYHEDVDAVSVQAERLAQDLGKEKLNKRSIQVSADGLKAAAKNLAAIATPVFTIATKIRDLVAPLM